MRKRTVRILTGIAIILVALSLIYAIWVGISAAKLRRVYAALEKDGRPMQIAEVIPHEVPETENAALLYESAILLLKAQPAPEKNLLEYLGNLSVKFAKDSLETDQLTELQSLLQQDVVTQALSVVQLGVERPTCRFDVDYSANVNIVLSHLTGFRDLMRIQGAKARFEAEAGRLDNAWDLALTQLRFANALRTEPTLVSQLVRATCIRLACRTIQRLCAFSLPDQQQYTDLKDLLRKFDDLAPLVRSVDGERLVFAESIFTLPRHERRETLAMLVDKGSAPWIIHRLIVWRMSFKPLLLADRATYMRLMHEYAGRLEGGHSRDEADTLEDTVADTAKQWWHLDLLTRILIPAMARVEVIHARMMAELRITQTGLALLRHREERGAFPESLDVLSLEALGDPFLEGPLRHRPETDGFVLYSVGIDQKDNGGNPKKPEQKTDYDIVWRFPGQSTR